MNETFTSATDGADAAEAPARSRLSFDLDVDICVVGAGLAGLTVALEAARLGASVAVLEGRHIGWNASGHQLGTVMPGFGLAARRVDRAHRSGRCPRTLVAVEGGRRLCPRQRDRRADAGDCAQRRGAGGLQRRGRRCPDQPAADARRGLRYRSARAGRSTASAPSSRPIIISTASIIRGRFRSTAANISTALPRWRGGQGRGFSRTRRSSASILPAFASGSSRRRRGCARRISCSPATSISARRCGGCRKPCCRSGATPR